MQQDISTREDLEKIVTLFYDAVKQDNNLRYYFTEVVAVDWNSHNKRMVDFWDNALFYSGNFDGDPLATHRTLNAKAPTTKVHFDRWIQLLNSIIDEYYKGENADKMKHHAASIADVMQNKI